MGPSPLYWLDVDFAEEYVVQQWDGTDWNDLDPGLSYLGTAVSVTITGLTNGVSYSHRVIAKNSAGQSRPAQISTDLPFAAPVGLDVAPENGIPPSRGRLVKLNWGPVTGATGYVVEVRKINGDWQSPANGYAGNHLVRDGTTQSTHYSIDLDFVLNTSAPSLVSHGLADYPYAYEFRVKATDGSVDGRFSDEIRLIDTPITMANGYSPGIGPGTGEALLEWTSVPDATGYTIRYRELPSVYVTHLDEAVSHTSPHWYPQPALSSGDWDSRPETTGTGDALDRLTRGEVYAIQLNYKYAVVVDGARESREGFSAREVYVWPSYSGAAAIDDTVWVAAYPLLLPINDTEFKYRICEDTFPDGMMSNGKDRRSSWRNAVRDALEQWEVATAGLITMTHETYFSPEANNGQGAWFSLPCNNIFTSHSEAGE